jgi:hypothetical protein
MSRSTRSRRPEAAARRAGATSSGRLAAAALLVAATAVAAPAAASPAVTAGTQAPAHVREHVGDLPPAGSGRLTWFGLHVYDAALYAPARFDLADPTAQRFVLELTYARRLDGRGIADASRDEIERLGFGTQAQRARWHEQMLKLFPDVEKGRRLAGVNVPGSGARFYFDGRFLGSIDEPAFARAFFAIWLDERTKAPRLREDLLKTAPARTAGT